MRNKSKSNTTTRRVSVPMACATAILALTLANCSKTTLGSESECKLFAPIMDSKDDTQQTRIEVRIHNDIGAQVCGWKPPK